MNANSPFRTDVLWSCARPTTDIKEADIHAWIEVVLKSEGAGSSELSVNLVDKAAITALNEQYRNKSNATNVLSFPAGVDAGEGYLHLGDIVVCLEVVEEEAQAANKPLNAHLAHMVVHGTLHLLGYDHQEEQEAQRMEQIEADILEKIGHPNPYELNGTGHE